MGAEILLPRPIATPESHGGKYLDELCHDRKVYH